MADHLASSPQPDPPAPPDLTGDLDAPGDVLVRTGPLAAAGEPVMTRARYVKIVTAALPAVFALLAAFGVQTTVDQATALAVLIGVGGVVVGIVNAVWAHVQAQRTRAVVTPVTDPRDAHGGQLVSLEHARAMAAEAAAAAAVSGQAHLLPVGTPTATPWDEDSTLVQEAA